MKGLKQIARLWVYLKNYKGQFFLSIFGTVVSSIANALEPFIIGLAITEITKNFADMLRGVEGAGMNYPYLTQILILYFVRGMFFHGGQYLAQYTLTNVVQQGMRDLRNDISSKINRLPVSYFDKHQIGDILSRVTSDVDAITNALQQSLVQVLNGLLSISFAIVMMVTLNIPLAFVVILTIPLAIIVARIIISASQSSFRGQADALGDLFGFTQENLNGFTEIKLYGKEEDSITEFKRRNLNLRDQGFKASFISSLLAPIVGLISNFAYIIVAMVGSYFAFNGALTIGNLQAFVQYVWQVNQPITTIAQLSGIMQSAGAAAGRIFEFLDESEEVQGMVTTELPEKVKGAVEFDHISFSYNPKNPLMKDISVRVNPGEMVAIVGPTGAGKTTLVNLLMRFYDVDGGSIKVDGVDIKKITRSDLRKHFGMVLQDAWLYQDSVMENLRFGKLDATDEEVIHAAEIANVNHFIQTLPNGYGMEINQEASNISLGQKQLMTIARTVLSDPDILILDEATSSVDTRLEKLIQEAMDKVMEGRTSFVIAHRLSTIRNADLILVMDQGSIIEQGTHDSLLAQGGFYANLYNSQFSKTAAE
ncbi:ATP-binding cassette, subfamily B, multidrug efflux pump [Desemzia incerta]|uniref:ATP-binding cassette, subfamily B, multidrug efflux pump n=1 Tax=Desemzia incerta TaxID=82801 RepID=A0A1I5XTC1_9LACT|nr:ABC transporter ATP-binding protein [Desemzia incerta]SFQ35223.1 ATP-binding cassette, subfamily B, multidrug efflux pump [Desemzia incerta]